MRPLERGMGQQPRSRVRLASMMHEILVLNAGSSSLKFAVFEVRADDADPVCSLRGQFAGFGSTPSFEMRAAEGIDLSASLGEPLPATQAEAVAPLLRVLAKCGRGERQLSAVGHRFVHGGSKYASPVLVDAAALAALDAVVPLAPLHMPASLAVLRAARAAFPLAPQIACFDTAFHATQPEVATRVALPRALADKGYRRYGFHGLNYEHVVAALPRLSGATLPSRLLIFHLGNGASICAVRDGASVATTMGYTPLDGLIMGTRCGSIDPGLLIALMRDEHLDADALERLLYWQSGLFALSGGASDMRELLARTDAHARLAVDAFCYWAARHAGSLAVALGGLDAIIFTGGMGENAAEIRARIAAHLGWLGVALDAASNATRGPRLSPAGATIAVWCIPADEEAAIARAVVGVI